MSLNPFSWLNVARHVDCLFALEKKHGDLIEAQAKELQALKDRMTRLEEHLKAREEVLIVEAKSAAREAASAVSSLHNSDISARLGRLEERSANSDQKRLWLESPD